MYESVASTIILQFPKILNKEYSEINLQSLTHPVTFLANHLLSNNCCERVKNNILTNLGKRRIKEAGLSTN